MAFLICQLGGGNYVDFELSSKPFTIGRSPEADLQIADERISRIHCGIYCEGDIFMVKDLGSTNGTFVNDQRVKEARLQFGDTVKIGHTVLAFESKPRRKATSKMREVIEIELPDRSYAEAMHQLSDEAISASLPPPTSPPTQ